MNLCAAAVTGLYINPYTVYTTYCRIQRALVIVWKDCRSRKQSIVKSHPGCSGYAQQTVDLNLMYTICI